MMRFPLLSAVLLVSGTGASALAAAQAEMPTAVPTKVVQNQWMVRATVNGHDGWFLLSTATKDSILLPRSGAGAKPETHSYSVTIGPASVSSVSFKVVASPELSKLEVAGVLGSSALSNFNLGLDVETATAYAWHDQPSLYLERGWVLLLPVIASSAQHATTLTVESDSSPSGIKGKLGLAAGIGVISTADIQGNFLTDALGQASSLSLDGGATVVDEVTLGELNPFWAVGAKSDSLPGTKQIATLPVTSLPVRRIVLDGKTSTIITEILSETGADSLLLGHLLGVPLEIESSALYVRRMGSEGSIYGADFSSYANSLIVSIAGIPAEDIVAALQGSTGARLAMLKRLAHARTMGYSLDVLVGENEKTLTIKPASGLSSK